jgi:hypothetical protein
MRRAALSGAYHYCLPTHRELLRILRAEEAEAAAIERLPAIPDSRQRLRAA